MADGLDQSLALTILGIILSIVIPIVFAIWFTLSQLKIHFQAETERLLKQMKSQFENELKIRRDELFLRMRAEKLTALTEYFNYHQSFFSDLKGYRMFLNQIRQIYFKSKEKAPQDATPFSKTELDGIISTIMGLEIQPRVYHEYYNEFKSDHTVALNKLEHAIEVWIKRQQVYGNDCGNRIAGWSLFIDNKELIKEIRHIQEEYDTINKFMRAENYQECEDRLEGIFGYEKYIELAKKEILAGLKNENLVQVKE